MKRKMLGVLGVQGAPCSMYPKTKWYGTRVFTIWYLHKQKQVHVVTNQKKSPLALARRTVDLTAASTHQPSCQDAARLYAVRGKVRICLRYLLKLRHQVRRERHLSLHAEAAAQQVL